MSFRWLSLSRYRSFAGIGVAALIVSGCGGPAVEGRSAADGVRRAKSDPSSAAIRAGTQSEIDTSSGDGQSPAPVQLPPAQPGDVGRAVPSLLLATSPTGHWAALCQALDDTDGNGELEVRLSQHGEFEGDTLLPVLVSDQTVIDIDEFAGADPSGRWVAYVANASLWLLDTLSGTRVELPNADVRASRAPFLPLRSVTFNADGRLMAYVREHGDQAWVVIRTLADGSERVISPGAGLLFQISFAAGGRFLQADVVVEDTNRNRRLQWPYPERKGAAPCPSPVPNYSVWQYPGDQPEPRLIDTNDGELLMPKGLVMAAGDLFIHRTDDQRLIATEPGKPAWLVSSEKCAGRVMHVDVGSGHVLLGCATGWGQRRDMFLRTPQSRKALGFDLAAFEVDSLLPTEQSSVALSPRNESLVFNLRTYERWSLLEGTRVLALRGNTALLDHNDELVLVRLNPDASVDRLSNPLKRPPLAAVRSQGPWVAVGPLLFDLKRGQYAGSFPSLGDVPRSPEALSSAGAGLYPARAATPSTVSYGPFRWLTAD